MTARSPTTPAPPCSLDDAGALAEDLPCWRCGYNLRTLRPDAACPECGESIAATLRHRAQAVRSLTLHHFPIPVRLACALFGAVAPIGCFVGAAMIDDTASISGWQSGELRDYAGVMLSRRATVPFWALALYATGGLTALLIRPIWAGRRDWVRGGLYVGVLLSAQYALLHGAVVAGTWGVAIAAGGLTIALASLALKAWLARRADRRGHFRSQRFRRVMTAIGWFLLLGTPIGAAILIGVTNVQTVLLPLWIFGLPTAPLWAFFVYGLAILRVRRTEEARESRKLNPLIAVLALGSGWLVSLGLAVRGAMIAYASLPNRRAATSPPRRHGDTAGWSARTSSSWPTAPRWPSINSFVS